MGKTTDTFFGSKFQLPQITVLNQTCAAGRASNIELSMLVLDIMVKCRQKILDGISVESMEYLNEDA